MGTSRCSSKLEAVTKALGHLGENTTAYRLPNYQGHHKWFCCEKKGVVVGLSPVSMAAGRWSSSLAKARMWTQHNGIAFLILKEDTCEVFELWNALIV
jgi:hypothetical protein